jgi:copper ion binding protein
MGMERNLTLSVEGMTCQHCVKAVQSAIGGLEGVVNVSVDLDQAEAKVTFDPDRVDVNEIIKSVEEAGYTASEKTT